jgi:hypothetical protein
MQTKMFGSYDNATAHVDPDYYISADGKSSSGQAL